MTHKKMKNEIFEIITTKYNINKHLMETVAKCDATQIDTFTKDDIQYTVSINGDTLTFHIKPNLFDDYEMTLKNDNEIFKDKNLIKNIETLNKIIRNGFKNGFDINVTIVKDDEKYIVSLKIDTTYIQDEIVLNVPKISKKITKQQLIEYVQVNFFDVRKDIEKSNKQTATKVKGLLKHIDSLNALIKQQNDIIVKYETNITDMNNKVEQLGRDISVNRNDTSNVRASLEHLTHRTPVLVSVHYDKIKYIHSNCIELYLEKYKGLYYIDKQHKYSLINFSFNDILLLTALKNITFKNCDIGSPPINCFDTLEKITFINMLKLTDLSILRYCQYLQTVVVDGNCGVMNFQHLSQCPRLKELIIPKGVAGRIVPKPTDTFEIFTI